MTLEDRKKIYLELLLKWNNAYNLVQEKTLEDFETRHWQDSHQLLPFILDGSRILDVGSGAGFPGLVLAIAGFDVTLCEINQKKMTFLKEVARQCELSTVAFESDVYKLQEPFDVVVSRAFADLSVLLGVIKNVSRETLHGEISSTLGFFLKGRSYQDEIEKARQLYAFNVDITPSQTSKEGVILRISNLQI